MPHQRCRLIGVAALLDGKVVAQASGNGEYTVNHGERPADEEPRARLRSLHVVAQGQDNDLAARQSDLKSVNKRLSKYW